MSIPVSTESLYINMSDVSNIITKLAISSQFKVSLNLNQGSGSGDLLEHLKNCGIFDNVRASQNYDLLCSQASLPSSTNFVIEERGSRQGVIEKFAYYRVYDNFSLTFYVDDQYNVIRLFEEWMNFINPIHDTTNKKYEGSKESQYGKYRDRSSYYRLRYPDSYKRDISITKFERNLIQKPNRVDSKTARTRTRKNRKFNNLPLLNYRFHDCFPVDIQTVPLTYDNSVYTQLTVGWTYSRHTIEKINPKKD